MKKSVRNQNPVKSRGGAREGAGRPAVNTLKKMYRLSPENLLWVEEQAAKRKEAGEKGVSQSSVVDEVLTAARTAEGRQ